MKFWSFVKNKETGDVELRIDGEIVSDDDAWIYEWFGISATSPSAFREALAEHNGKPITVWIDSRGGDVFAAIGIYTALMEHKGDVTVKIDGKAYSAASIIAMSGTEILMSPGAMMLVHNPWTEAWGEAKDLRHVADLLDEVKEAIMNVYELRTGRTREDISVIMDVETPMSAATAIEENFADGMLYSEAAEAVKNHYINTYRPTILNYWNQSIKRMLELKAKQDDDFMDTKPPMVIDDNDDVPVESVDRPPEEPPVDDDDIPLEKNPTTTTGRVFDKRVKVREINHRRIQTHG